MNAREIVEVAKVWRVPRIVRDRWSATHDGWDPVDEANELCTRVLRLRFAAALIVAALFFTTAMYSAYIIADQPDFLSRFVTVNLVTGGLIVIAVLVIVTGPSQGWYEYEARGFGYEFEELLIHLGIKPEEASTMTTEQFVELSTKVLTSRAAAVLAIERKIDLMTEEAWKAKKEMAHRRLKAAYDIFKVFGFTAEEYTRYFNKAHALLQSERGLPEPQAA